MIDDLKEIIELYKDFVECETATARVLRNVGNEDGARDYEETSENDKRIVALLTELEADRKLLGVIRNIVWDNSLYDGIKIDKLRRLLPDCNTYPKYCKDCPDLTCSHSKRGEEE